MSKSLLNNLSARRISKPDRTSWDLFKLTHLIPRGQGICLDLGCGPGAAVAIRALGYKYLGVDSARVPAVTIFADAHHLPFASNSVELVLAASSFEHFSDPFAVARELHRILKPSGIVVASLSFLEPYHAHSYYHMSHLGARKLFEDCGFKVLALEPFEWTGIEASVYMLFRLRVLRWLTALWLKPVLWLRVLLIRFIIRRLRDTEKKARAEEFLQEEPFRFTAGIKIKVIKDG